MTKGSKQDQQVAEWLLTLRRRIVDSPENGVGCTGVGGVVWVVDVCAAVVKDQFQKLLLAKFNGRCQG